MTNRFRHIPQTLRRFARGEDGAQLVEFALILPMMLLVFAVIVEGGRLMWSFQAANAGVRDATRYLARVAPSNICDTMDSIGTYVSASDLATIVEKRSASGRFFGTKLVEILSAQPSYACFDGTEGDTAVTYRVPVVGVAEVTATVQVTFPFAGLFELAGGQRATFTKTVTDQSRIFGT
ncbi:TadE/TadG family type IV pilus assembly protein [Tropicimonas isoalkanivorans]|uniref:TadE-like protein n=1 Tax=Tropicimonas isoalkanivorans TaxID=441112 RepID=A0A1I1G8I3_9RHOB|nr:TadE/TadG family type IV pilus assembly protein [Tropicimonas isoalkanivorans]SFC07855.1 TadE-like protein [Tropicimonas isoalkanivorans]